MSKLKDHVKTEHAHLRPHLDQIRTAADAVGNVPPHILRDMTESTVGFLLHELLPHARMENEILYKALEEALHAPGSSRVLQHEHTEISRYVDELTSLNASIVDGHVLGDHTVGELRRVLYGIYALVMSHFAKEDHVVSTILEAKLPADEQDRLLEALSAH
jgi:iron-sulfur cluster repair protein YtfE (RIC family)